MLLIVSLIGLFATGAAGAADLSAEIRGWRQGRDELPRGTVVLRALVRRDADPPAVRLARGYAPRLVRDMAGRQVLWIEVDSARVLRAVELLEARSEVIWIERFGPMVPNNDKTSWLLQSASERLGRTVWDHGLDGAGQVIGVADTGLDVDACQFRLGPGADAVTRAVTEPQPPDAIVDRPDNKVLTYYVLGAAEAYDSSSSHFHGTHAAGNAAGDDFGNLAGRDPAFYDLHDGMAPGARLVFQDIGSHDGYLPGLDAASMYDLLHQAYATGARIHSNSYGRSRPSPGYDIDSASIDEAIWRHHDLLVLFSAGNSGPDPSTLTGTGSTAKNTLVVGASGPAALDVFGSILDLRDDLLFFSSQGPTTDGRTKPDLAAPGMTFSATSDPDTAAPLGCCDRDGNEMYAASVEDDNCDVDVDWPAMGTSFSTPVMAGAAALVRQYFGQGMWYGGKPIPEAAFGPSAALLKAVLVLAARPLAGGVFMSDDPLVAPPAFGQGWGRVSLEEVLWFEGDPERLIVLEDARSPVPDAPWREGDPPAWPHTEDALRDGDGRTWRLPLLEAGAELRVCLAWSDPPAEPGADPALVNDLDLAVEGPDGARWLGNRGFGPGGLAEPVQAEEPDRLNNLECVALAAPHEGVYTVEVHAASVPGNGMEGSDAQGFALAAVAPFVPPAPEKLRPARVAPGKVVEDLELAGRHFAEGMTLDLGPGVVIEGIEVLDENTARIESLRVAPDAGHGPRVLEARLHRSVASRTEGLFRVGEEGCGCGGSAGGGGIVWLLVLVMVGMGRRRCTTSSPLLE